MDKKKAKAKTVEYQKGYRAGVKAGVAKEREACADICDAYSADKWALYKGHDPYSGMEEGRAEDYVQGQSAGSESCGELIRERSN